METAYSRPESAPADFPGRDRLVAAIDAAVGLGRPQAVATALRLALARLIRDPEVALPDCVQAPVADHYARRELYRSPAHGYSVVAMTWGPGQGTPLHDHSGLWCVEGVCRASWTSPSTNCRSGPANASASAPPAASTPVRAAPAA
jgi:hypothetical protein